MEIIDFITHVNKIKEQQEKLNEQKIIGLVANKVSIFLLDTIIKPQILESLFSIPFIRTSNQIEENIVKEIFKDWNSKIWIDKYYFLIYIAMQNPKYYFREHINHFSHYGVL